MIRRFFNAPDQLGRTIFYTTSDSQIVEIFRMGPYPIVSNTYGKNGGKLVYSTNIEKISELEFYNSNLTSIKLPSIKAIEKSAFAYTKLTQLTLPDSVVNNSFGYCDQLESIEFGSGEIYFGYGLLTYCTSLKKMIFHGLNPSIYDVGSSSFDSIRSSGISVYYPTEDATYTTKVIGHLDRPATADVNNFFPVTLMSDTTTVIGKELYERCVEIAANSETETVNLPGTVMIDGMEVTFISYYPDFSTTMDIIAGKNEYRLYEDGYLKFGM